MTGLTVGQNRKVRIEGDGVLFLILCVWNDEKEEKEINRPLDLWAKQN